MTSLERYNTDPRVRQYAQIRNGMGDEAQAAEIARVCKMLDVQDGIAEEADAKVTAQTDADTALGAKIRALLPEGMAEQELTDQLALLFQPELESSEKATTFRAELVSLFKRFTGA